MPEMRPNQTPEGTAEHADTQKSAAQSEPTAEHATHVAVIMDGNGRWAQARGKPRLFGHHAGAKRVKEIVRACPDLGVKYLTIFAFSTENWKRTQTEVSGLMSLFRRYIQSELKGLVAEGVRVRFIGDRPRLDKKLIALMDDLEEVTRENTKVHLTIAINYGGRDEVSRAIKEMARDVKTGVLDPETVDETTLTRYLDTRVLPDPDLVIRTSGEARISNFLLWQSAYSEYEFIDTLWPDFTSEVFADCMARFAHRDRRFGGVKS
ncbi:isoprenyl transferase [Celeribacter baekdonensis]|uniref:Isoprenyl transferase n=1 Tax=Celeribacter baekdonensis TaxID=875171 RepID=A0A2R4M1X0_9RHOB|nr:isoprenyl transferase [Celeribacter baekdonensis]AVW91052.1 isoprenyl transferase [Celeribacter baekdonensis]